MRPVAMEFGEPIAIRIKSVYLPPRRARLSRGFSMPRGSPACEGSRWGTWQVVSSGWGSGYCAVIQPVGNLIGVITPLATHPVRGNAPSTCPFPQRHWMHIDKFTQFSGGQSSIAATKVVNDVHLTLLLNLDEEGELSHGSAQPLFPT